VTRIDINYCGKHYSVGDRNLEQIKKEVESIITAGSPGWMQVNSGSGSLRTAHLLITAGVPLVLVPIELPDSEVFERSQSAGINSLPIDPPL
jgi:hypothetical protein